MHFTVNVYYTIISKIPKIRQKFKIISIVKINISRNACIL